MSFFKDVFNTGKSVGGGALRQIPGVGDIFSREDAKNNAKQLSESYGKTDQELYSGINPGTYDGSMGSMNDIQRSGIQSLMQRAKGGLNDADRAANFQLGQQANQANRGAREAILSQARGRGQLTSGNTLAATLAANEGATNRLRQNQLGIAGMAAERSAQANQNLLGYDSAERAQRFQQQLALAGDRANLRTGGALSRKQGQDQIQAIDASKRQEAMDALMKMISMGAG